MADAAPTPRGVSDAPADCSRLPTPGVAGGCWAGGCSCTALRRAARAARASGPSRVAVRARYSLAGSGGGPTPTTVEALAEGVDGGAPVLVVARFKCAPELSGGRGGAKVTWRVDGAGVMVVAVAAAAGVVAGALAGFGDPVAAVVRCAGAGEGDSDRAALVVAADNAGEGAPASAEPTSDGRLSTLRGRPIMGATRGECGGERGDGISSGVGRLPAEAATAAAATSRGIEDAAGSGRGGCGAGDVRPAGRLGERLVDGAARAGGGVVVRDGNVPRDGERGRAGRVGGGDGGDITTERCLDGVAGAESTDEAGAEGVSVEAGSGGAGVRRADGGAPRKEEEAREGGGYTEDARSPEASWRESRRSWSRSSLWEIDGGGKDKQREMWRGRCSPLVPD